MSLSVDPVTGKSSALTSLTGSANDAMPSTPVVQPVSSTLPVAAATTARRRTCLMEPCSSSAGAAARVGRP
jgi:hypothetical protein